VTDPIQVEAEFTADGAAYPLAFTWGGRRHQIVQVGRQEVVERERRVLVMVEGDQVYELSLHLDDHSWHIRRRPEDFGPVKRRV
jgi:hypothetical protein